MTSYEYSDLSQVVDATYPYSSIAVGSFGVPAQNLGPIATAFGQPTGIPVFEDQHIQLAKYTEEVRLASKPGPHFDWLVGAYVTYEHSRLYQDLSIANADAGLVCGPLAKAPAILFFVCMCADYPAIGQATLPSDVLLRQLRLPVFHLLFQAMIFCALLESGTGMVHAVNARLAHSWSLRRGTPMPRGLRLAAALALLVGSIFVAGRFGLVTLIAKGYSLLRWVFLLVYVAPLLSLGVWRLWRMRVPDTPAAALEPA